MVMAKILKPISRSRGRRPGRKPVAKLVPYAEPARASFFGSMKATVLKYDRPFDPIDGDYDINRS